MTNRKLMTAILAVAFLLAFCAPSAQAEEWTEPKAATAQAQAEPARVQLRGPAKKLAGPNTQICLNPVRCQAWVTVWNVGTRPTTVTLTLRNEATGAGITSVSGILPPWKPAVVDLGKIPNIPFQNNLWEGVFDVVGNDDRNQNLAYLVGRFDYSENGKAAGSNQLQPAPECQCPTTYLEYLFLAPPSASIWTGGSWMKFWGNWGHFTAPSILADYYDYNGSLTHSQAWNDVQASDTVRLGPAPWAAAKIHFPGQVFSLFQNDRGKDGKLYDSLLEPWGMPAPKACDACNPAYNPGDPSCAPPPPPPPPPPQGPTCGSGPTASPASITLGGSSTISYSSTGATSISFDQGIGPKPVPGGSFSVSPTQTTTYTQTVNGVSGTTPKQCAVTVYVNQPPPQNPLCTLTPSQLTANSNGVAGPFNYTTANASSANVNCGVGDVQLPSGSFSVTNVTQNMSCRLLVGFPGKPSAECPFSVKKYVPPPCIEQYPPSQDIYNVDVDHNHHGHSSHSTAATAPSSGYENDTWAYFGANTPEGRAAGGALSMSIDTLGDKTGTSSHWVDIDFDWKLVSECDNCQVQLFWQNGSSTRVKVKVNVDRDCGPYTKTGHIHWSSSYESHHPDHGARYWGRVVRNPDSNGNGTILYQEELPAH